MKQALKHRVPAPLRQRMRRLYSRLQNPELPFLCPYITRILNPLLPPKRPAVLLVSLPRGGSSWVGSILGASDAALYLREPLTHPYMRAFPSSPSFFELDACKDVELYRTCAANAFAAIPRFSPSVIPFPNQWSYRGRRLRRVVIKEVNPLVLDWIIAEHSPRVVYLLRHPVAVANSFFAQNWTGEQIESRFGRASMLQLKNTYSLHEGETFWAQSGALQALVQNIVMTTLRSASDFVVVKYEELCASPSDGFAELFEFSGLEMSGDVRQLVDESTQATSPYAAGEAGTRRDSSAMKDRWRSLVENHRVQLVKSAYFSNDPIFYRQDEDW